MKVKIIFEALSPLLAGGRKQNNNYIRSLEYIPGNVVRASLVQHILDNCIALDYEDNTFTNILEFKNSEYCKKCTYISWCKNFDQIKLTNIKAKGCSPWSKTSLLCKYNSSHRPVDLLHKSLNATQAEKLVCPDCSERLESPPTKFKNEKNTPQSFKRQLITKGGIDATTGTNAQGRLYSIDTIADWQSIEQRLLMETTWDIPENIALNEQSLKIPFDVLRFGAYTRAGLGKCRIIDYYTDNTDVISNLKERINAFNKKITKKSKDKIYLSLDLQSDADLNLDQYITTDKYYSNNEYMQAIKNSIKESLNLIEIDEEFELIDFIGEYEIRRGWDTRMGTAEKMIAPVIWTLAGSVIVLAFNKELVDGSFINKLVNLESNGIGKNTENGCGEIIICNDFHVKYSVGRD
ncbi:hypothetical protein SYNTR_1199 [Candidatus Syntrophocurvum alkaliphilum]|uniref:Uncharacterized protein n=2 Tax=Candidatus Syntrophocurvum alkaliphilum TaxID=2293317 RepID=A0A6I6DFT2_9FIRM|nr:hypothetical protein SYNTR_1199 [Candidatus Syntrophocurvum alkaliphilum]